ncbi:MAG TPA: glycosyltransferase [Chthoniobacteraceae bacterium]|jgi:hypothetical protein|nr:glycosyltransferase [Chthoniobacteraceae bacterium]
MRIGIFTKMDMPGGSKFRAVELANAVNRLAGCQGVLLVEKRMPDKLRAAVAEGVEIHPEVFANGSVEQFHTLDRLLVINSDSRDFTKESYWLGQTEKHSSAVDLSRIRNMTFLFNYIVSPACQLPALQKSVADLRLIVTNTKFFEEISKQDRYLPVRHYPRLRLESPIGPATGQLKTPSARVRFGMHSLPNGSKWNEELPELVRHVNEQMGDRVAWDFMGIPDSLRQSLAGPNITCRPAFSLPVPDYLQGIDVFLFFLGWKREEAWARSAAEALMSGCPVITTNRGGNRDKVIHGNTGFLGRTLDEMTEACIRLATEAGLRTAMGRNAKAFARSFSSANVAGRLVEFLQ